MKEPNFIIAGERRSGTTTIAKWIQCHPEIYINPTFDKAFFMDDELRGALHWKDGQVNKSEWSGSHSKEEYLKEFVDSSDDHIAVGEKSADYLFLEDCHERMFSYYPDAKIVLTLRNPIKRSWSHYWNEVGKGREDLNFREAIDQEDSRIAKSDFAKAHLSYTNRGKYINSIKKLLTIFPRENVHIIILEEAIANPKDELAKLYMFLGVDPTKGMEDAGKRFNNNWTTIPKKFWLSNPLLKKFEAKFINRGIQVLAKILYKDFYLRRRKLMDLQKPFRIQPAELKMDNSTKDYLINFFGQSIKELEEFLGKDLSIWKK